MQRIVDSKRGEARLLRAAVKLRAARENTDGRRETAAK